VFVNKDYIMRMIEQFMQVLLSIAAARKAGKHDEAFIQIQDASRVYLEKDITSLVTYTPTQLLDYFRKNDKDIDAEHSLMCADLILEMALISDAQKFDTASVKLKLLSLHLYINTLLAEIRWRTPDNLKKVVMPKTPDMLTSGNPLRYMRITSNFGVIL